jgi:hypothetical protein
MLELATLWEFVSNEYLCGIYSFIIIVLGDHCDPPQPWTL